MVQRFERIVVCRRDDAENAALIIGLLHHVVLHVHLRRRGALLLEDGLDVGSCLRGRGLGIRDRVESVDVLVVAVVAFQHVVVERYGSHDQGRRASHAHDGAEHAALIVHAVVHDGLNEQRQLVPNTPLLVEVRLARRRLRALQKLDGMLFQDTATSEVGGRQHERQLDDRHDEEQPPPEVGGVCTEGEHAAKHAADDALDQKEADDGADDGACDDRDGRIPQEARRDLALTEAERLLRADLRNLLAHDAAHRKVTDEQTDYDEQRRHGDAQIVGHAAERAHLAHA